MTRPRIVVIGAGFAGLSAARTLAGENCDVFVVDRENYHVFSPLLYQVACAELEAEQVAYPVRGIFRREPNVQFILAEVLGVDFAACRVLTDSGDIAYDSLLIAGGGVTNVFHTPGAAEYAFYLKTLPQAAALRNRILECFERAALTLDPAERRRAMTFTVIGGGPTGVEFAGALAELIRGPILHDFSTLDVGHARVVLVQSPDSLLPMFPEDLRRYALRSLTKMGVEVRLNSRVAEVASDHVKIRDGGILETDTVVWAAGVRASLLTDAFGLETGRGGRILATPELRAKGRDNVFLAGDVCIAEDPERAAPMVAQAAMQQGAQAAQNILRRGCGLPLQTFIYEDKGSLAVIGRRKAAAWIKGKTYTGAIAWLLWVFVHIYALMGFRNRVLTLVDWAWDYLFGARGVRIIFPRGSASKTTPLGRPKDNG